MDNTYSGIYYMDSGQQHKATLFFSAVTITIRYYDELSQEKDVYWLTSDLTALQEQGDSLELQYKNKEGKAERLVIRDVTAIQTLKKLLRHHRLVSSRPRRILGNTGVKLLLIFLIIAGLLVAFYFWGISAISDNMAKNLPKDKEIAMGEEMYQSISPSFQTDPHKTAALNAFFKQLHYNIGYPVQITVVKSGVMNAFAIPGGHIVVYDAILDNMKTPEELAALLAHEASHVALRHSLRNIYRSISHRIFLAILTGHRSSIASVAIQNANNLEGLSYSRSLETEADDNGLQLMANNHINTEGMLRLMQMLQTESGKAEPPAILSTHPVFKDRIDNIQQQLKRYPSAPTQNDTLQQLFHDIYESNDKQW